MGKSTAPEPGAGLLECLGLKFRDPALLDLALTHSSYANEIARNRNVDASVSSSGLTSSSARFSGSARTFRIDNERLEFLGDAVLSLAVNDALYKQFPEGSEGWLSSLKSKMVCETALAGVARTIDLGRYIRMGRGEHNSGGTKRPSILADALEALLGAVYLDQGYDVARALVMRLLQPMFDARTEYEQDPKTRLQEWLQSKGKDIPRYKLLSRSGPDHASSFISCVLAEGSEIARGKGKSKRQSEQEAARAAYASLVDGEHS